jgi:hypothetical protein
MGFPATGTIATATGRNEIIATSETARPAMKANMKLRTINSLDPMVQQSLTLQTEFGVHNHGIIIIISFAFM